MNPPKQHYKNRILAAPTIGYFMPLGDAASASPVEVDVATENRDHRSHLGGSRIAGGRD